jgi:hypothetical protein
VQDGLCAGLDARFLHQPGEHRAVAEHRRDLLLAVSLGVFDGRLHNEDRTRVLVDEVTDRRVDALGVADARGLHQRDALDGRIGDRVEYAALIGERVPPACRCRALGREIEVPIGPLGQRQQRGRLECTCNTRTPGMALATRGAYSSS